MLNTHALSVFCFISLLKTVDFSNQTQSSLFWMLAFSFYNWLYSYSDDKALITLKSPDKKMDSVVLLLFSNCFYDILWSVTRKTHETQPWCRGSSHLLRKNVGP